MSATILVVDDIIPNVKLLEAKLRQKFFHVLTATDGHQAIDLAEEHHPDLILLDVMMPGLDGFDVCKYLKSEAETAHIPIVLVTALTEMEHRVKGLKVGADDFLSKPVNDHALFARIYSLLRVKQTVDEMHIRLDTLDTFNISPSIKSLPDQQPLQGDIISVGHGTEGYSRELTEALQETNYTLTRCSDFERALEAIDDRACDLLLVNTSSDGDSSEAERTIPLLRSRAFNNESLPCIVMCQEHEAERWDQALKKGVIQDYILPPHDSSEIIARIDNQLRRRIYRMAMKNYLTYDLPSNLSDNLTELFNRDYLIAYLRRRIEYADDYKQTLSLLLADIDHFDVLNETYGQEVGDQILRAFSERLASVCRDYDLLSRVGGEEFVIVLGDTYRDHAFERAFAILRGVAEKPLYVPELEEEVGVTCSIGGVLLEPGEEATAEDLIDRADLALYDAKDSGRNCIYFEKMGLITRANVMAL